jgi:flagellin
LSFRISTNVNTLQALSNLRQVNMVAERQMRHLTTGSKVDRAVDGPSELAMETTLRMRISGNYRAVQNSGETIDMIQTADAVLGQVEQLFMRMRDLLVKAANEAVGTQADRVKLLRETDTYRTEIGRVAYATTFNTKDILAGRLSAGAAAQVGADNGVDHRITISIPNIQVALNGFIAQPPPPNPAANLVLNAQNGITQVDRDLSTLSDLRASLGVAQRRLQTVINDLSTENINQEQARSRLGDTDFVQTLSDFTRSQILLQSSSAILAQSNAQPQSVLQLLR